MDSHGCTEILKSLEEDNVSRVELVGQAGIGKTWMARKICERATSKEGSCYISLWLNLNKDVDIISLYEDIASQLSIFLENKEGEEDDSDEDDNEDEEDQIIQDLMRLKDQIHKKLKRKKSKGEGKKYLLLVLDDEGSVIKEEKVMKDLHFGDFLAPYRPLKILLTRRKREDDAVDKPKPHAADELHAYPDVEIQSHATDELHAYSDGEIVSHAMAESHLNSHTIDKSHTLRDILTNDYLVDLLESLIKEESLAKLHSLEESWGTNYEVLRLHIVRMSMRLPAALVVLAKSLNRFSPYLPEGFKAAILSSFQSDAATGCESAAPGRSKENPILRLTYELLDTAGTVTIADCFWHSLSFFEHCGCVYYQELIAHWILEGYFDPVRSVAKAYKDGHDILMELIKRGFMKIQEENVVMPEVAMKNLIDLRRRGLSGTSRIGLAKVCGSDMTKGLGKTSLVDDIIEAVRGKRKGEKNTTVLVSGNRLRRESLNKFFRKLRDVEILGLFEPRLDYFVPMLSKLEKLRVLVIRDCNLLKDIEEIKALQGLHVLEVSGASSLKEISDDFFKAMHVLQSLHLSGLQIKSSPSSISELTELHRLIIRDCPLLVDLPDLQELVKLEVVDVSGARGLQTCFDKEKKNKSKNVNFCHLQQLQFLDLSESQIDRLPIFQDAKVADKLHSLTRLLLRNCRKLTRLPNLKPLSGLQILDLSGATSLVKMLEVCFEDKKELRVLSLSGTNIRKLPSTIEELSNLSKILLAGCPNLEALPSMGKLTNLEIFDASGCTKLQTIAGSFKDMFYLREVSLSGTRVKIPPELPTESRICCLKKIVLADGRLFKGEKWSQIKEDIEAEISEDPSSSGAVVKSQEIEEIQPNEPRASDCTEKGDVRKERLLRIPIERDVYKNILTRLDSASQQEVMKVHKSKDLPGEALANAEFVSLVDISSTRLTSIFNETKSVKSCSLWMCTDIKELFSGVDEANLGSLETLSITNLPLLETICWGSSCKNLKKLSIECCPNIKMLFPEASQVPSSLKDLHIKYCEKLEKVVEGVELSTFTNLTWKVENCPNFHWNPQGSDWVVVDCSEESL